MTIQHRHGNRLDRLKEDGSIVKTQEDLENTLNHYFANLLQELDRDREEAQREVLRYFPKLITEDHNKVLGKAIEMSEFEMEVTQMAKDKASGPDGFTSNFFHTGWEWLKEEIVALVEKSRRSGNILKVLNSTFMALIPKESGTKYLGKLKLIALCNVIYKIISKVIANRLKPLLPLIISMEHHLSS